MIDWKIYYGDGSTFSNEDGPPEMAPCGGVICVAYYDDDNRRHICHLADYYVYDGANRWMNADASGFWQYMGEPGAKIVKFGRLIGDLKYREIMTRALNGDLPISRAGT